MMSFRCFVGVALWSALCSFAHAQAPVSTAFVYQGDLQLSGTPADDLFDMEFALYDSLGVQIGTPLCVNDITVSGGRFSVSLDFGSQFDAGFKRFLEVRVREDVGVPCANGGGYTTLAPRQELTTAPFAAYALRAGVANSALDTPSLNGQTASFYTNAANMASGILPDVRLSTNVPRLSANSTFTGAPVFNGGTTGVSAPFSVDSTFKVTSLNADLLDGFDSAAFAALSGTSTFSGTPAFNGGTTGVSAPFSVDSTFKVTNLNADLLDGFDSAAFASRDAANTFTANNVFNGTLGVGTASPEAPVHVLESSAGTVTANSSSVLVLERAGSAYLSLLTPAANDSGVLFGTPTNAADGGVLYNASGDRSMQLRTGGNTTRVTIDSLGNVGIGAVPISLLTVGGQAAVQGNLVVSGVISMSAVDRFMSINPSALVFDDTSSTVVARESDTLSGQAAGDTYSFYVPLELPHLAVITAVDLYALDSSANNATLSLHEVGLLSGVTTLATVATSGSVLGVTRQFTQAISEVVDNQSNSYVLRLSWTATATPSSIAIRGMRISYRVTAPVP